MDDEGQGVAAVEIGGPNWVSKCDYDEDRGVTTPIPSQVISNEEYAPLPQTAEQLRVEHTLLALADHTAKRLGMDRRQFLATTGGMATAFVAMNAVFGPFFDVDAGETVEPAAYAERWPKGQFIFDIQTHHVARGRSLPLLLEFRRQAAVWNPELRRADPRPEDLYLANYIKEVFFDSETVMAVISGVPAVGESHILPPADMIETRAQINGLARSQRIVSHGLFSPDRGPANLREMQEQAEVLKVQAWKGYPGLPVGSNRDGWWMDDERVAYPAYEYSRRLGITTVCVHKGLPLPGFNTERCSPRDVPKAAADFPDLSFLVYHSAFKSLEDALPAARDNFATTSYVPWVSDLCQARKQNPRMSNVYMEIGSTFAMLVMTSPLLCGHVLGMIIDAFGADHVLWGTDAIWWGSPQWQIEAFRRFRMPERLMEKFGYRPLTTATKERILGLNAARVYGIDVPAKRQAIPGDYLSRLKAAYEQDGGRPRHTQYGWVRG